jgi:hypothetical protein
MSMLIIQVQMLLAAISALLPLAPVQSRARAAELLDLAARALAAGGKIAADLDDLALKLSEARAEVEAIAAHGRALSPEDFDAALGRVRAASARFRAALKTAEQGV